MSTLAVGNSIGLEDIERAGNWLKNMDTLPYCDIRDKVFAIEKQMLAFPQLDLPVEHFFSEGVYARKLIIPKDAVIVGKIHKYRSLNILLKGGLSVLVDGEIKQIKAPFISVAPAGMKRIAYAIEDSEWLTVHGTDETDLSKIEDIFIAQSEQEWLDFVNKQLELPLCHG